MNKDSKKIWIIVAVIVIAIILLVISTNKKEKEKEENKTTKKVETLELSQVMEIEDIEKSKYETEKSDSIGIATKYMVNDNKYELKANIKFMETTGKMIYVREETEKLNIYQTEYKLDKYENINSQIEKIIREFEKMSKRYINIEPEEKVKNETLYGESSQTVKIPLGESIYNNNRLYSKTYEKEGKTYDINFYKNGEKINCELVYKIQ